MSETSSDAGNWLPFPIGPKGPDAGPLSPFVRVTDLVQPNPPIVVATSRAHEPKKPAMPAFMART
jgi:hypothetical protein